MEEKQNSPKRSNSIAAGTIFFVLACLYIGFLLYQSVYFNYQTNKQISSLRVKIAELEQSKDQLDVLIAYYKTDSYRELEARKKLGMKMPGEKVVKVDVRKTETADSKFTENKELATEKANIQSQANWQLWVDFFDGGFEN